MGRSGVRRADGFELQHRRAENRQDHRRELRCPLHSESVIGDEIVPDLDEQLTTLRSLAIGYLDLRGAWGKNALYG